MYKSPAPGKTPSGTGEGMVRHRGTQAPAPRKKVQFPPFHKPSVGYRDKIKKLLDEFKSFMPVSIKNKRHNSTTECKNYDKLAAKFQSQDSMLI